MMPRALLLIGIVGLASETLRGAESLCLEGYCDPMSVRPGEEVGLCVSTNAKEFSIEVVRAGAKDEVVWTKTGLPGREYPAGDNSGRPGQAAMEGCSWPAAVRLAVPDDWPSGFYRVVLRSGDQTRGQRPSAPADWVMRVNSPSRFVMFFVVRAAEPGKRSKILLQLASNTYQAYNGWGGSSLYSGPAHPRVSFRRPMHAYPWASPDTWELPLIRWAQQAGYPIDVCTNLDLEQHPEMLPHYRLVLSVGHDEYWSAGMRDALESFVANGGNCAFLSGNTCCWQVRVEDDGRALVCYKRVHERDPAFKTADRRRLTTLWSDPLLARPENLLTGVGFAYGGYNGVFGIYEKGPGEGEYTVHRPEHWLLAGTGLQRGQTFGKDASIAGYEMDGCEMVFREGLPCPTGRDGAPKDFEIVATAPGRWAGGDSSIHWARQIRGALPVMPGQPLPENVADRDGAGVLGVYTRGGTVVTAGSTDWANGLAAGDPVVDRVTRNLFDRLAGPPQPGAAVAGPPTVFKALVSGRPLPTAENFPPRSPEESLRAMNPRPGFKVELMAAEPLVMDPVDIAWGPDGKAWVVEMADYPLGMDDHGKPGGRVRWLEDTNGDGVYDKSTLFLDGLNFPNGCMPWRKGVLVTCAPEVFYAEDTDGDGKADVRRPLFTGFGEGNQQHRVNHPRWGLDNWVYLANGDGGAGANGVVRSVHKPDVQLDIRGRDLRIRPDDGSLDVVAGQAQYGRNRDDWGNWFGCDNNRPIWYYAVEDRYVRRNPHVAAPPGRVDLTPARTSYPCGWVMTHHALGQPCPPLGQPGAWTCLCGVMIYRDELLGPEFYGNGFFADAVYNCVSRCLVSPDGVLFRAGRADDEQHSEFLASYDPWFRPASIRTGPDGALWVVDMYRFVIEHPQWINDDLEKTLELRLGHDKGRIWRVFPADRQPRAIPRLDKLDVAGLVAALDSPSGWQRDLAQQMLLWRNDKSAVPLLEKMTVESRRPLARLHALCTLEGLGTLPPAVLRRALTNEHPGVRRHAVRLAEPLLAAIPAASGKQPQDKEAEVAIGEAVLALADDPDLQVCRQVAHTFGEWKDPRAGRALGRLAVRHADDPYMLAAVFSSAVPHVQAMLAEATAEPSKTAARAQLTGRLLRLAADIQAAPDLASLLAARRRESVVTVLENALRGTRSPAEIEKAIEKFEPVLTLPGDAARGKQVFVDATCSTCHRLSDLGTEIGPDLATLVDRSPQYLRIAVIDPNRAFKEKFMEYTAVTSDGQTLSGMLVEETSNSLTLVDTAGKHHVLLRKDLEELIALGRTHMAEKLEEKLTPQQMADLFAFVRGSGPQVPVPVAHAPAVVRPQPDGSLRLLARHAEIRAAKVYFDGKQDCLVWHPGQPDDHVVWSAEVPKAGVYQAYIQWTQVPEYADNPFSLEAGPANLKAKFPSTGGWGMWQRKSFGQIALAAGRQRIVLRPDGPIKGELSDLREVHLVPVER